MFEIVGGVGVAWPTPKLSATPFDAMKSVLAATCGVRVQVPTPTKLTVRLSTPTVQTLVVDEVTDGVRHCWCSALP